MGDWQDLGFSLVVKSHQVEKAEPELHVLLPDAKDEQEKVKTYLAEHFTLRDLRRGLGLREYGFLSVGLGGEFVGNWPVCVVVLRGRRKRQWMRK